MMAGGNFDINQFTVITILSKANCLLLPIG